MDKNMVYFVTPFYTGGEMYDLLQRDKAKNIDQPLSEEELKPLIYQILCVLSYLKQ